VICAKKGPIGRLKEAEKMIGGRSKEKNNSSLKTAYSEKYFNMSFYF
jgi:hypothetical protein